MVGLVMGLCEGGDLNSRIYSEDEALVIIRKILATISYCHENSGEMI